MALRPAALALAGIVIVAAACTKSGPDTQTAQTAPQQADHRAADEAAIRGIDSAWGKAIAAKNAQLAASYYADDGILMAPGDPMATGRDAVQKAWVQVMALPGFGLTITPDKIVVVGDVAYEIGSYALTVNDKGGKPSTNNWKYVVIWSRQSDGSWKAVLDAPTTTS